LLIQELRLKGENDDKMNFLSNFNFTKV